jgi:hypothetical protein
VRWCGAAERLRAVERLRAAREREMESCDCVERETERQRKGTRERKRTTLFSFHPCPLICFVLLKKGFSSFEAFNLLKIIKKVPIILFLKILPTCHQIPHTKY